MERGDRDAGDSSAHAREPRGRSSVVSPDVVVPAGDGFAALGVEPALVAAVTELGYEEPTPIQRAAIPPLLAGRDVLGQAATGTGKTAAFALPLLQRVARRDGERAGAVRGLIVVPTRELAMQVGEAVHRYGRALGVTVLPIYGGQSLQQQLRALQRGVDVVVATPGRALDHVRRGTLDLGEVRFVVLDEADEMLDMGFAEELEALLDALPEKRQSALFSATMARRILVLAERRLHDPERITIAAERAAPGEAPRVREVAYVVQRPHKVAALTRVLDMESPASAMVFCRTRTEVDTLCETLGARGYDAEALHGGLSQDQRERVLRRFREGASDVLVATDVAARGLDIEHVSHVVNFDVPSSPEAYLHRIGRTGRAGREGVAISLVEPREHRLLRNIEALTKRKIATETVPTVHELRARRLELARDAIEAALERGALERYRPVVEALAAQHDVLDVAAAAVRLFDEARDGEPDEDEIPAPPPIAAAPKKPLRPASRRTQGAARVYVGLGRLAGIRPADLVGAIVNEARIDPKRVGAIEIADRFSLVEVPDEDADRIIAALRRTTIRGKPMRPRRDRAT